MYVRLEAPNTANVALLSLALGLSVPLLVLKHLVLDLFLDY